MTIICENCSFENPGCSTFCGNCGRCLEPPFEQMFFEDVLKMGFMSLNEKRFELESEIERLQKKAISQKEEIEYLTKKCEKLQHRNNELYEQISRQWQNRMKRWWRSLWI